MPTLPPETAVDRLGLAVADVTTVADFYEAVVGLDRLGDDHLGAGDHRLLELTAADDLSARPADAAGLFHVAFRVPTRAALADALSRLQGAEKLTGASDHLVSEALYSTDPANNGVEIYCDRPRDTWEHPEPGRIRLATLPLDLDELATAAAGASGVPTNSDLGHVHLEVTELDAAEAFYVETLGFDISMRGPGVLFVSAGGYHHHVALNTWNGRTQSASGRGLRHVTFNLPNSAAIEALRGRLAAAGADPRTIDAGIAVTDPDGIELRFVT